VSPALEIGRMDQSSTTLSGLADVGSHQEWLEEYLHELTFLQLIEWWMKCFLLKIEILQIWTGNSRVWVVLWNYCNCDHNNEYLWEWKNPHQWREMQSQTSQKNIVTFFAGLLRMRNFFLSNYAYVQGIRFLFYGKDFLNRSSGKAAKYCIDAPL
jgi:hypothetical protein